MPANSCSNPAAAGCTLVPGGCKGAKYPEEARTATGTRLLGGRWDSGQVWSGLANTSERNSQDRKGGGGGEAGDDEVVGCLLTSSGTSMGGGGGIRGRALLLNVIGKGARARRGRVGPVLRGWRGRGRIAAWPDILLGRRILLPTRPGIWETTENSD